MGKIKMLKGFRSHYPYEFAEGKDKYLRGKRILPKPITGSETLPELIDQTMLAYNGARLKEACRLFSEKMLGAKVNIGMSLAGAMTPAGLGCAAIIPLIKAGFVDWIVSTGANLYHDLHHALVAVLVQLAGDDRLPDQGQPLAGDPFPPLGFRPSRSHLGGRPAQETGVDPDLAGDLLELGQGQTSGRHGSHRVLALEFGGALQELAHLVLVVEAGRVLGFAHGGERSTVREAAVGSSAEQDLLRYACYVPCMESLP